jgi:hypothetical protein
MRRCPVEITTIETAVRFRMPAFCGVWMLADGHTSTAHTAVVSAYKPSTDARNAAQGGAGAWGPPV